MNEENRPNEWGCTVCKGTGQNPGKKKREKCPCCKGKGVVTLTEHDAEVARYDVEKALSDQHLVRS